MKRLFALLLIILPLLAQSYNEHILKIEANIIPRIILMDYKFEEKLADGQIAIAIVYDPIDLPHAKNIKKFFEEKYPKGIKGYPLNITLITYDMLHEKASRATLYYLMDSDAQSITKAIQKSVPTHTLVFTHDSQNLKYGAHVSLRIDKKIVPYLNPASLKKSGIVLRPALLSISEFYQ